MFSNVYVQTHKHAAMTLRWQTSISVIPRNTGATNQSFSLFLFTKGICVSLQYQLASVLIHHVYDWQHAGDRTGWLTSHERVYFNPIYSVREAPPPSPGTLRGQPSVKMGMIGGLLRSVWAECDSLRPKG